MDEAPLAATVAEPANRPLEGLSAQAVADLLLAALAWRRASTVEIEPSRGKHAVRADGLTAPIAWLEPQLADAVVARLALLAGLDLTSLDNAFGRLKVESDPPDSSDSASPVEILVGTRAAADGLVAELRRLPGPGDLAALIPAVTAERDDDEASLGNYRLIEELGRGGMGVVYRAEHLVLQKPVAIKLLLPGLATQPLLAAQFVLEARAACRARHPGIVDVTDFGRTPDRRAFIVMELVEGPTLAEVLSEGPLPPQRVVTIARGIASALRAAAAHGVVHRDLKPGNVFVLSGDRVKLCDFGVACIVDPSSQQARDALSTNIVGTAAYMAPEQGLGERTDARSDLYSLGCVMFEMLTGRTPFQGKSSFAVVEQHVTSPVPAIDGPSGPVPEALQRIVLRAMAKNPGERYQSADELLADLRRAARTLRKGGWRQWLPR